MDDPGYRRPARVADRISALFGGDLEFSAARHELCGDRVGGVCWIDQCRHIGGQADGKFPGHPGDLLEPAGLDQPAGDEILPAKRAGPHHQVAASRS